MRLRSIELEMPDSDAAAEFLQAPWGLVSVGQSKQTHFLRGAGDQPYVVSVTEAPKPAIASVTFSGTADELEQIRQRADKAGARYTAAVAAFDEPGGAGGFLIRDAEGHVYRFVTETGALPELDDKDRPLQITHVPMNSVDADESARFAQDVLGFRMSDRTKMMNFMRCDPTHHALAFVRADCCTLNHIAFEMRDTEAVMRGMGRMKDAGYETVWGPGRHGPGNNVFAYYIAPFGAVVEYTSEVQRVDDSYKVGGPDEWKWPPNRMDHWGLAKRDEAKMHEAERSFRFRPLTL
jgi:2,3-dihydroxy-p-cumate/2,3-dihydroxybenzoate 3,4-dioxygenase